MNRKTLLIPFLMVSFSCKDAPTLNDNKSVETSPVKQPVSEENPYPNIAAIPVPAGFTRVTNTERSFGAWLRNVSLKKDKTVFLYDGSLKRNQRVQFAVLDISLGKENLQQCADAVMRLRAEYLFAEKRSNEISFTDNEGHVYKFSEPFTRDHFTKFMDKVFAMCGSASLAKQLKHITLPEIMPGDVFIRGGFPGHAVIVMDVAENSIGKKIYLIAQSYMPAQDIHLLINNYDERSPWYEVNEKEMIYTPEYTFRQNELMRW